MQDMGQTPQLAEQAGTRQYKRRDEVDELVSQVDDLVAQEIPVKKACLRVGLSRDTYYLRKRQADMKKAPTAIGAPNAHLKEEDVNQRIDDSTSVRPSASAPKEDLHDANN